MRMLLGLLIIGVLLYLLYRNFARPAQRVSAGPLAPSGRGFAFLSNGLVFLREHGGDVQQLESEYVQEAIDRRERSRERHSWKQGTSFNISAGGGMRSYEPTDRPMVATAAAFEPSGDLIYFFKDDTVGGLFRRDATSGRELRVLLKQNLNLSDLCAAPSQGLIAASSQLSDGVANIVLLNSDGSNYREATGGDTVDSAPTWIPDAPRRLLFQSAGLARDERGYIVAQGNASIQMLNMESGSVSAVVDDPRYDYLKPRVDAAGNLLYIRRPYSLPHYGASNILLDTLLFPFRLARALFHYLNFFSMMYSRQPLTSASGPAVKADLKSILLQGRRIDAEKALRSEQPVEGIPSLVPSSWMLIKRDRNGQEQVLATNVASYDVTVDGTIVYTNGRAVFVIERNGSVALAMRDQLVADIVAWPM